MHYLLLYFLLISSLFADTMLYPTACCPAYNNLKHTRNSGQIVLDPAEGYLVRKQHHKGQYLIQVKGASPAQRWVDESCLAPQSHPNVAPVTCKVKPIDMKVSEKRKAQTEEKRGVSYQNLLALSWHNAFCETHRYKKECKRGWGDIFGGRSSDDNFVLHGLWPQPRQRVYCNVPKRYVIADKHKEWHKLPEPKLSSQTKARLKELMPGVDSNLHRHEWIKHGTCYGIDAEHYFSDAIALTQQVRESKVAVFFRQYAGKRVTLQRIRELFDQSFGIGTGRHVELRCNRGMITELWLHLGGQGNRLSQLLQNGKTIRSQCQRGIIDRAGYGR